MTQNKAQTLYSEGLTFGQLGLLTEGSFFMQYIPAGNCQGRWWSCPREPGWAYQRAAASDRAETASKLADRRNSIQMELERSLQNWSCWRFQQILPGPQLPPPHHPRPRVKKVALEGALGWNCWGPQAVASRTTCWKWRLPTIHHVDPAHQRLEGKQVH